MGGRGNSTGSGGSGGIPIGRDIDSGTIGFAAEYNTPEALGSVRALSLGYRANRAR